MVREKKNENRKDNKPSQITFKEILKSNVMFCISHIFVQYRDPKGKILIS